jgi:hypothetical protein
MIPCSPGARRSNRDCHHGGRDHQEYNPGADRRQDARTRMASVARDDRAHSPLGRLCRSAPVAGPAVDLYCTKEVVGLAVTISPHQRLDKVVPGTFGRLLDVTQCPGANLRDAFGEQVRPRSIHLIGPGASGDLPGFVHRPLRVAWAGIVDK